LKEIATLLRRVNRRLLKAYGKPSRSPPPLDNKEDPLDELIYITLTQRTHAPGSSKAYENLKRRFPEWARISESSAEYVYSAVEPSGLAPLKTKRIVRIVNDVAQREKTVSLDFLRSLSDEEAQRVLTKELRVGQKTARAVMMYSLGRDVFPADTHCLRILRRLGAIARNVKHETANRRIEDVVPPGVRYDLHVNMVHHGRAVCTSRKPKCTACVLDDICPKVGLGDG